MSVYCSVKHENSATNRFCTHCGEPLPLPQGQMLLARYRIVRLLGQGGFGRTYLVEDVTSRQNLVVKEFAPQVEEKDQLRKAKELFEREASVLKKLHHPQIPGFRETLEVKISNQDYFFLVQDYVEGDTYDQLLETRKSQGKSFSQDEVKIFLQQLLPVLAYIHGQNVIHRDISPDNIICRKSDNLPMLIDFGGVKQLPASHGFWFTHMGGIRTVLGKKGYAPEEQLRQGQAFPSSDLYAMAVTALVLLTGKEPQELYDSYQGVWRWGQEINLSLELEEIFKKLLAYKPSDRYQKADQVIQALSSTAVKRVIPTNISRMHTMLVSPKWQRPQKSATPQNNTQIIPQPKGFPVWVRPLAMSLVGTSAAIVVISGTLAVVSSVLHSIPKFSLPKIPTSQPAKPTVASGETTQIEKIISRRQALGIPSLFFNATVNEQFYTKHPDMKGRSLTANPEDTPLRQEWHNIASELLDKIDKAQVSTAARQKLGSYGQRDDEIWKRKAEAGQLGGQTLAQLTKQTQDKFDQLFSQGRRENLNPKTYGQIWYAIATDIVSQLEK
jgi:serine/threonine protein kinase